MQMVNELLHLPFTIYMSKSYTYKKKEHVMMVSFENVNGKNVNANA